jgi:GNAT superfamily N-acetyltransferase
MTLRIGRAGGEVARPMLDALAALLVDAVQSGASVGFPADLDSDTAAGWWSTVIADVDAGGTVMVLALDEGAVVGSVLLRLASMPNGRQRAEVSKLLVLRSHRRRGLGTLLMAAVEQEALVAGRTLLLLDTETGSPAETLYRALGYVALEPIPDYALRPDGTPAATTIMWRDLLSTGSPSSRSPGRWPNG